MAMATDLTSEMREKTLAGARALEGKRLFVKAAERYLKIGMEEPAAAAYENGGAFEKAAALFEKLGRNEDVRRCEEKKKAASDTTTWDDLQSEFQQDRGNPY